MITDTHRHLYWKTNSNPILGYNPGELVVTYYKRGGGFAGRPEVFVVSLVSGIGNSPPPEPAVFPAPSDHIEYVIGGHLFTGYNSYNPNLERKL